MKKKKFSFSGSYTPISTTIGGGLNINNEPVSNYDNEITKETNSQDISKNKNEDILLTPKEIKRTRKKREIEYFKIYSGRKESNGNTRYYIDDIGDNKYFEIFVWLKENEIIHFDVHYDIHNNEKLVTWKKDIDNLSHSRVTSEKEKYLGMKKMQTIYGKTESGLGIVVKEFKKRVKETKKRNENQELINILKFISSKLK